MNKEQFMNELKKIDINISVDTISKLEEYYHILVEENKKYNLTAITEEKEVYLKHFYDSLTPSFDFEFKDQSLCDIGAGAGFPSIPLKIVYPELKITIVDSLSKRITFLNYLTKELGLTNVKAVAARAEEYAIDHRESFDIVSARAVARLNILDELCLPLAKVDGYFITLKGRIADIELEEAMKGIETLGGKVENKVGFTLSSLDDQRCNIYIKKEKSTPKKYPRAFGQIKKKPL